MKKESQILMSCSQAEDTNESWPIRIRGGDYKGKGCRCDGENSDEVLEPKMHMVMGRKVANRERGKIGS